ncbi:MAG: FkbM family methyltransferase [Gemmatimonadales bacterium]|nr:FkbM family methyltransferase [Gemmatimonadales bacterium]
MPAEGGGALRLLRAIGSRVAGRGLGLGRSPTVRRLWGALLRAASPGRGELRVDTALAGTLFVRLDGSGLAEDLVSLGVWERAESARFLALVAPGMTVLDVGANIGWYTMLAARAVGPAGRVIAVEPDPDCCDRIRRAAAANGHAHVTVVQAAASDRAGRATFHLDAESWGHSLGAANVGRPAGTLEVETRTLDAIAAELPPPGRVDVLKVDVQGAEGMALAGAAALLRRDRPALLMELEPGRLRAMGTDPLSLLESLEALGYRIGTITEDGREEALTLPEAIRRAEAVGILNVVARAEAGGATA